MPTFCELSLREYAAGTSPRTIARRLNAEGIPSPTGKLRSDSSIKEDAKRGAGLLNYDLCIAPLVCNRQRFVKNPETGRKVSRINPPEEWIVVDVPELRMFDDKLRQAVKDRQEAALSEQHADVIAVVRAANTSPVTNPSLSLSLSSFRCRRLTLGS